MDWVLIIFSFWHTFASFFGCSINILLIYLCLYKSPKSIQVYGTFIINFAITDFLECLIDMFIEARVITIQREAKVAWQFNGFCQFTSLKSCQYGLSVFFHCMPHGLWSLLLSFSYRLYILKHPGLKRIQIILALLIVYIPSLIQLITFPQNLWDLQLSLQLIHEKLPSYEISNTFITAMDFSSSASAFFTFAHVCLPIYPVYIIIFILRRKIVQNLMVNEKMLSKETKAVHAQMLKCLTYQSLIPAFLFIGVCLYFLAQFGIVNNRLVELGVMTTYIPMPVLSSLTYICFVRPYREYCKRIFCNKEPTSATNEIRFNSTTIGKSQIATPQC